MEHTQPRRAGVLVVGMVAVLLLGAVRLAGASMLRCPTEVDAALAQLRPHRDGDLALTRRRSLSADDEQACTQRVFTSRSTDEVVAHYRSELAAHHWRVRVRSQGDMEGQCSSGPGQCRALEAFGPGVCFALNTDTVRPEQAVIADRTSLFFAAPCAGIADFGSFS